ncbi:uncharacterized protein F4807DRAFT_461306 [Annulohypoxylon truncatum]|uniref:uncharacterized protein n=1 Tax=Annulohypoxylon truncatum TaxID=327061 RepID=UPI00200765AE|nr:uncharacterized protein F4807DRAFT_461306 [Annulohypoxylon truncatum]KAI1208765.1 hypothetical protein F4807DRAFT_461306 [Annulohypoxylon truncatum]
MNSGHPRAHNAAAHAYGNGGSPDPQHYLPDVDIDNARDGLFEDVQDFILFTEEDRHAAAYGQNPTWSLANRANTNREQHRDYMTPVDNYFTEVFNGTRPARPNGITNGVHRPPNATTADRPAPRRGRGTQRPDAPNPRPGRASRLYEAGPAQMNGVSDHDHIGPYNLTQQGQQANHRRGDDNDGDHSTNNSAGNDTNGDGHTNDATNRRANSLTPDNEIPAVAFTTQGEALLMGEPFIVPTAQQAQQEAGRRTGPARIFSRHETVDREGRRTTVEIDEDVEEADITMSGGRQ